MAWQTYNCYNDRIRKNTEMARSYLDEEQTDNFRKFLEDRRVLVAGDDDNPKEKPPFNFRTIMRCFAISESLRKKEQGTTQKDKDHFIAVVGRTGSGKSTLAMQLACWIDPLFRKEHLVDNDASFGQLINSHVAEAHSKEKKLPKVVVIDEARLIFPASQHSARRQVQLKEMIVCMRALNLCYILCTSDYWRLDTEIRERINTLFYLFEPSTESIRRYGYRRLFKCAYGHGCTVVLSDPRVKKNRTPLDVLKFQSDYLFVDTYKEKISSTVKYEDYYNRFKLPLMKTVAQNYLDATRKRTKEAKAEAKKNA